MAVTIPNNCRHGQNDLGDALASETGLDVPMEEEGVSAADAAKQPFVELNSIVASLHNRDLQPALQWAALHRQALFRI